MAAPNYFRRDGWVKTVLGAAIPGAQVYVCLQPANVAAAPPSPLASIYSDPMGLVPITQPILTDGFGHYDFYSLPNVVTVVIAVGNVIQEVLPDQSIGGVGGGGSIAPTFESSGVPFANQQLINFYSSDGTVIVTPDVNGDGGVNLQAPLNVDVNGTPVSSTNPINFESGTGITVSNPSAGNILITNSATGTVFSGVGAGQFAGPGITLAPMAQNLSGVQLPGDGTTYVYKFVLDSAWTLTSCTFVWTNNLNGTISFALYTSSGAKISNTDNFMATDSGTNPAYTPVQNTFSATVLPAGVYYFAYASSGGSGLVVPGCALPFTSNSGTAFLGMVNKTGIFIGTAANSRTGNAMPSTLGALTGASTGIVMPTPIWAT